ncbi:MAG: c-type cytochrome [bacterium]
MDLLKTVLVLVLLVTACARDTESLDPKQLQRMSVVRERLKNRLGEKYRQPVPQATPQQLARGQALYAQLCAPCHGPRGEGSGKNANRLSVKPTDFTDPQQASFYSEQARLYIIRKGIQGTPMMGWENVLSDADIVAVYLYIRSFMKGEESQ